MSWNIQHAEMKHFAPPFLVGLTIFLGVTWVLTILQLFYFSDEENEPDTSAPVFLPKTNLFNQDQHTHVHVYDDEFDTVQFDTNGSNYVTTTTSASRIATNNIYSESW